MKGKLIKRIMIASLLVSSFAIAPIGSIYAAEKPDNEEQSKEAKENIADPPSGENVVGNEKEVEIDIDTPASVTGEKMEGNGTVVDFTTNGSKAFYTIVDNDQQVFYLIIDMDKTDNNVYFLSEINRAELDSATANQDNGNNVAPTPPADVEQPEQEVQSETETSDNNLGFLIAVLIIGGVGALAYYFLVLKKKKKKNEDEDENEDEMIEDYEDDFEEDNYEEDETETETENNQEK